MNPTDLAKILDELGQRLGPTGEHVFQLAVRQVYIDAVLNLGLAILALVMIIAGGIVAARFTLRRYAAAKAAEVPNGYSYQKVDIWDYAFPWFMGGLFGAVAVLGLAVAITSSLSQLLNPEYAALRQILGAIKP